MALVKIPIHVEKKGDGAREVTQDLKQLDTQAKKTDQTIKGFGQNISTSAGKAAGLADAFGRTSTTLARSAEVFGLNANALRAMDDAADVAELGFKGLSETAVGLNAATMGVVGAGLALGTAIGGWLNGFASVRAAADDATRGLYDFLVANKLWGETSRTAGAGSMQGLKEFSAQMGESHKKAIAAQAESLKAAGATGAEIEKVMKAHQKIPPEVEKQVKGLKESEKAAEAYAEKIKKAALEYAALTREMDKAFGQLSATANREMGDALLGGSVDEMLGGMLGDDAIGSVKVSVEDMERAVRGVNDAWHDGELGIGKVKVQVEEAKESVFDFGKAFAGVADTILDTFINGGDIGAAIENSFAQMGKNAGEAFGTAIGGPLGGAIGGALGGLLGKGVGKLFGGLFGDKEIMKVNEMRDAFLDAQGGFVELQKKLVGLTDQDLVKKIFDARTVEEFNAAVEEVNGLLGNQQMAQEKLQEAIDKYGFSIEELGPKFQQQKLHEQALALYQDFQLLTASGIDVGTVIEKMGPDLTNLVENARKTGQALPEALRPVIDALIEQGLLLDENGQAFESAEDAGVTFAKSLEEGLQGAIDAIDRLVAALTGIPVVQGGAGSAAPSPSSEGYYGPPSGSHADGLDFVPRGPLADGGSLRIVHPGEAILNSSDASQWRSGGQTTTSVNVEGVHVYPSPGMDEAKLADLVVARLNEAVRTNQGGVVTRMEQARRRQFGD